MRLNNKGFAISGVLYSLLILFVTLFIGILTILATTKFSLDKVKKDVTDKLEVESLIYHDSILNGADPVLKQGLVPVTIDSDGTVKKADLTQAWYDYENKVWANAVTLSNNISKQPGDYVSDYSGNGNSATIVGNPTQSPEGLVLDGYDDRIFVGDKLANLFKSSNTVQIMVKRDETGIRDIFFGNYSAANSINYEVQGYNYRVYFNNGASNVLSGTAAYNKFVLVTFVFDKPNNLVSVYEDSTLITTMSATNYSTFSQNFNSVYIGGDSRTGDTNLKGTIQRVMIYGDTLTEEEIQKNMSGQYGKVGTTQGIVADNLLLYYDFRKVDSSIYDTPGTVIPESAISNYFVWVPRYKYKLWYVDSVGGATSLNPNNVHSIDIVFENKNSTKSDGSTNGTYLTHPAFTFGDEELNGIWVGKFETGYMGATTTAQADNANADSAKVIIKPNSYSWRSMNISNMFYTALGMNENERLFGLTSDSDTHMMKNTEWGAVTYLAYSKYGKDSEIYTNNNSNYLTGCGGDTVDAAENPTCLNGYGTKTDNVYNQSTTGNISGAFDMSGGAWEYVMGYTTGTAIKYGSSGFTTETFPEDKYIDIYTSTSSTQYGNRILGDATGEMGPFASNASSWYGDYAYFINSDYPWFVRGSYYNGSNSGITSFYIRTGDKNYHSSFRVVLA